MGFNKIKCLSNKLQDLVDAVKDSKIVEVDQTGTKIRKKMIIKDFIN